LGSGFAVSAGWLGWEEQAVRKTSSVSTADAVVIARMMAGNRRAFAGIRLRFFM
jgi:hypothetical protein